MDPNDQVREVLEGFNIIDGVLLVETLQTSDDATLSTIVRLANGFAYTVEAIRLKKGFKPLLPPSKTSKRNEKTSK